MIISEYQILINELTEKTKELKGLKISVRLNRSEGGIINLRYIMSKGSKRHFPFETDQQFLTKIQLEKLFILMKEQSGF